MICLCILFSSIFLYYFSAKVLWELIEPTEKRIERVREFLEDIDPSISYDIVPIDDIYGPTKDDPTFEMIVVSEETIRGGQKINELRNKKGLNNLAMVVVNLEADPHYQEHEEAKISSSNYRMRLLGTRLKDPVSLRILNVVKNDSSIFHYVRVSFIYFFFR